MSTSVLPRAAVVSDETGQVWYPFRAGTSPAVLLAARPVLPVAEFEWADLPADEPRPHVQLDLNRIAHLVFDSGIPPESMDLEQVQELIEQQLAACHCDLSEMDNRFAYEYGEHPEGVSYQMARCLRACARLMELEF